jgi:hypothetical protein
MSTKKITIFIFSLFLFTACSFNQQDQNNQSEVEEKIDKGPIVPAGGMVKKNNVETFFADKVIEGADLNTIELIGTYHSRDKENIYYRHFKMSGVDVDTFEVIDNTFYAKDKNYVYYELDRSDQIDIDSFEVFPVVRSYSKDKDNIYFELSVIKGADHATFDDLDAGYAKDKNHVYFRGIIVEEADTNTFEVISIYGYAKDKDHVFQLGEILEGEDPATFSPER